MDKDFVERVAITYINEKVSMRVLSERFGVSKTAIVRALNGNDLSPTLREILEVTKRQRWIEGKSTSGHTGHKLMSAEEVKALASSMVEEGLTLRDFVTEGSPSLGTIYANFTEENLGSELYSRVQEQYASNKQERRSSRK